MANAAHHARFITRTNLAHVNAHFEARSQLAHQLAEVNAIFGLKIEHGFIAVEQKLHGNGAHVQPLFLYKLAIRRHNVARALLQLSQALRVFLRCQAHHGLKRRLQRRKLLGRSIKRRLRNSAVLGSTCSLHDYGVALNGINAICIKPKSFRARWQFNGCYAGHRGPLLYLTVTCLNKVVTIHYNPLPLLRAKLLRMRTIRLLPTLLLRPDAALRRYRCSP